MTEKVNWIVSNYITAGMSEEDRLRGVQAANALADRILDIYYEGGPSKSAGTLVNVLFHIVQWRIARIARKSCAL